PPHAIADAGGDRPHVPLRRTTGDQPRSRPVLAPQHLDPLGGGVGPLQAGATTPAPLRMAREAGGPRRADGDGRPGDVLLGGDAACSARAVRLILDTLEPLGS